MLFQVEYCQAGKSSYPSQLRILTMWSMAKIITAMTPRSRTHKPQPPALLWVRSHQGGLGTQEWVGTTLYSQEEELSKMRFYSVHRSLSGALPVTCTRGWIAPSPLLLQRLSPLSKMGDGKQIILVGLPRCRMIHKPKQCREVHCMPGIGECFLLRTKRIRN